MFELLDDKAISLTTLFAEDLQPVYEAFAAFTDKHGFAYFYNALAGKPPKGLMPVIYRQQYNAILSKLSELDNQQLASELSQKREELKEHASKIRDVINQQQSIIDDAQLWLESADNNYANTALLEGENIDADFEHALQQKQAASQLASIKKAGMEKALAKLEKDIRRLSAILEWLEYQAKVEAAEAASKVYQEQLKQFAAQFREYRATAKRAKGIGYWVDDDNDLITEVNRVLLSAA